MKNILLIISGGIAAYKSLELIRTLVKDGYNVRCVATKAGLEFVTPLTLSTLSGNTIANDLFKSGSTKHIELTRTADLVVVCPATANIMAKMANGIADDLASSLLLASDKSVLVVPSMNTKMWEHPATKRNIATLKSDGANIMDTASGELVCGEVGAGRMPEISLIKSEIDRFFS